MDPLKHAIHTYGTRYGDHEGVASTPVPGLLLKCIEVSPGNLHAISRPLLVMVLQGAKHLTIGCEEQVVSAGESVIVRADLPTVTRIIQASPEQPYIALAVELQPVLLREVAAHLELPSRAPSAICRRLFAGPIDTAALDCVRRLVGLLERPRSIPLLQPGIIRELHYWLLCGPHGPELVALSDVRGSSSRIGAAIAAIRAGYRQSLPVEELARTAGMSLTSFHRHFKRVTSLTPLQYQKRLRLIEARRLMLSEGISASSAAFAVGYESVSQFVREYGRLFQVPPKRDVLAIRSGSRALGHTAPAELAR